MIATSIPECILLVDDDEATNYVHQMVIKSCGYNGHIQIVQNGRQAIEYLTRSGKFENHEGPMPGIIFLDINMPLMNGWEFLEQYKELPHATKAKIVIAMLTTSLNPDDEDKAVNYLELKGYISKPLTKQAYEATLKEYHAP